MKAARLIKQAVVAKLERKFAKLCQQIYELSVSDRRLTPRPPYVLVRVLPKEHRTEAGIWLADTAQNKPMYEGIVLAVWEPYDEVREKETLCTDCGHCVVEKITIHHQCDVTVGQRVTFPHYEGLPMSDYLDDKYYRLIREGNDQNKSPYCSVAGIIDYQGDVVISKKISKLAAQLGSVTTSGVPLSRGADPN